MEPERPIEKLLRASARKRREEAGAAFELHAATRRLLQGEVARHYTQPERTRSSWAQRLLGLWPRLALGLGIFASLAVIAAIVFRSGPGNTSEVALAKHEPELPQLSHPAVAPLAVNGPA